MTCSDTALRNVKARIEWRNNTKGYGFAASNGRDTLRHEKVLRASGQEFVAEHSVNFRTVTQTVRGLQVAGICSIDARQCDTNWKNTDDKATTHRMTETLPVEPARVKWFDTRKGFGFANVFGKRENILLHDRVLRQSGFPSVQSGDTKGSRVFESEDGKAAVQDDF